MEEAHDWDQNASLQRDRVDRVRDADVRCLLRTCVYFSIRNHKDRLYVAETKLTWPSSASELALARRSCHESSPSPVLGWSL